eukprot:CCRYP_012305-RA/>CCRYP_012305-RA protein AED:0.41 eAED:0.41 QI:0/0/0/1/0/0/2/0/77
MFGPKLYRQYICKDKQGNQKLENSGMEMNPYYTCIANKVTREVHQLTVLWHVDDLKISCQDKFEVMKLICCPRKIHG